VRPTWWIDGPPTQTITLNVVAMDCSSEPPCAYNQKYESAVSCVCEDIMTETAIGEQYFFNQIPDMLTIWMTEDQSVTLTAFKRSSNLDISYLTSELLASDCMGLNPDTEPIDNDDYSQVVLKPLRQDCRWQVTEGVKTVEFISMVVDPIEEG
jgi:hypothetical protein